MAIVHFSHDLEHAPIDAVDMHTVDNDPASPNMPYVVWKTHVGICLSEREANGSYDSDFFMLVWNWGTMQPEEICFASTRGWTYPALGSSVDATPEVRAAYDAWRKARDARLAAERNERISRTPAKGKTLRLTRNIRPRSAEKPRADKDETGVCFWAGVQRGYGYYGRDELRVGIRFPDGRKVFTTAASVEVVLRHD